MSRCRRCGVSVFWARTETGKVIPVDSETSERGGLIVFTDQDGTLRAYHDANRLSAETEAGHILGPDRWVAHTATCRNPQPPSTGA